MEMMKAIYYKPHAHVASYAIGVIMGYYMFTRERISIANQSVMGRSEEADRTTTLKKVRRLFSLLCLPPMCASMCCLKR